MIKFNHFQFTECPELDYSFEQAHQDNRTSIEGILDEITSLSKKWLKEAEGLQLSLNRTHDESLSNITISHSSFWSSLIQHGVKYKALLALLCYYMCQGQRIEASVYMRNLCLSATSLYFVLLGTPGSGPYKIFNPLLYKKALDTFKIALKLHLVRSPKKKVKGKRSQMSQPAKIRSRHGSTSSGISDILNDLEDSDEEEGYLTQRESEELTKGLNRTLSSLLLMLDNYPLKRSLESLELTIIELVELTHLETSK